MSKIENEVCRKIQTRANDVCTKIQLRAEVGLKKYGTTMEREDFSELDWMTYLQEELMDAVVYLQRMIKDEYTFNNQLTKLIELLPKREFEEYVKWLKEQES